MYSDYIEYIHKRTYTYIDPQYIVCGNLCYRMVLSPFGNTFCISGISLLRHGHFSFQNQSGTPCELFTLLLFLEPSEFTLAKLRELFTFEVEELALGEDNHQLFAENRQYHEIKYLYPIILLLYK